MLYLMSSRLTVQEENKTVKHPHFLEKIAQAAEMMY